jgi:hypothetical protein
VHCNPVLNLIGNCKTIVVEPEPAVRNCIIFFAGAASKCHNFLNFSLYSISQKIEVHGSSIIFLPGAGAASLSVLERKIMLFRAIFCIATVSENFKNLIAVLILGL